jgi:GNAT superfamily N-acetyltransferase
LLRNDEQLLWQPGRTDWANRWLWYHYFSIHNLGLVGHIEDIAVAKDQQGKKLGLRIIQALDFVAENVGCYKTILDCSEANEGFYVKCGFKRAGLEMAHYYEKKWAAQ